MAWQFRPRPWAVLGTVAGCALCIHLSQWQLARGRARAALLTQYAAALQAIPQTLAADARAEPGIATIAGRARGHYLAEQLLLDNQVRGRVSGYDVLSPLALDSGGLLMIDRGWVPAGESRRTLPRPEIPGGTVEVHGLWRPLPRPALALQTDNCAAGSGSWPRLVEYPRQADLRCLYGQPVADGVLLMAPDLPGGYRRDWAIEDGQFPPSRHYGYAAQWFAFAATLLFFFIKLNFRRRP